MKCSKCKTLKDISKSDFNYMTDSWEINCYGKYVLTLDNVPCDKCGNKKCIH